MHCGRSGNDGDDFRWRTLDREVNREAFRKAQLNIKVHVDSDGKAVRLVPIGDFLETHGRTNSWKYMRQLERDIQENGIREPILYVLHQGVKFVVDGHHRLFAARGLRKSGRFDYLPAREVKLPYGSYRNTDDLNYSR